MRKTTEQLLRQSSTHSSDNIYPDCSSPTKESVQFYMVIFFSTALTKNSTVWRTNTKSLEHTVLRPVRNFFFPDSKLSVQK